MYVERVRKRERKSMSAGNIERRECGMEQREREREKDKLIGEKNQKDSG